MQRCYDEEFKGSHLRLPTRSQGLAVWLSGLLACWQAGRLAASNLGAWIQSLTVFNIISIKTETSGPNHANGTLDGSQLVLLAHQLTATSTCPGTSKGRSGGTESERLYVTLINNKLHPPPIQHPPPIGRADRRNAPKGAQTISLVVECTHRGMHGQR